MALIENTLEGGTEGTSVTAANSGGASGTAFTNVSTPSSQTQYRASAAYSGLFGMLVASLSTAAPIVDLDDAAAASSFALRFYLRLDSYPSVSGIQFPIGLRTLSGALGRTEIDSTGGIRISGIVAYSTNKMALSTWYRVECQGTGFGSGAGAATIDIQVYVGNNTGTPYITQTLSGQTIASPIQRVRYGKASTSPTTNDYTYAMDNFAQNIGSSTPIGPAVIVAADAGPDQSVNAGDVVTLSGTGPGVWSQSGGSPTVTLAGSGSVLTFNAPYTASGTVLTFSYGTDSMTVTVAAAPAVTAIENTAEGGLVGLTATTGNSGGASGTAFSTVSAGSGGSITYQTTGAYRGGLSYQFTQPTASTTNLVDIDGSVATAAFSVRVYIKIANYPTASDLGFPLGMRSASGPIGRIDMNTSGQIRLVVQSGSTSSYSSAGLALNTWYRLEFYGLGWGTAASEARADVYVGDNTGTPYATTGFTGFTTTAPVIRARFGKIATPPDSVMSYMMDDFAVKYGTAVPIGPSAVPPAGNAGPDQLNVNPGDVITLTATGGGVWSQVSGPTVAMTGTGYTRTFTAPPRLSGATLVFGYGGDTMTVTVVPATVDELDTNNAEGGTNAVVATTANTGGLSGTPFSLVSQGSSGVITFSSAAAFRGGLGYWYNQPSDSIASTVDLNGDLPSDSWTSRFYLKLNTMPVSSGVQFPVMIRGASGVINRIEMNDLGQIRVGTTYSTTGLTTGVWYRIEYYGTGAGTTNTTVTADVYIGDADNPIITSTITGQTTTDQVTLVRYGKASNTPASQLSFYIDDIAQSIGSSVPLGSSPTGYAGPDQTVEPWSTVTLTATDIGTWTQKAGTPVTLNGSGLVVTFVAPGSVAGENLVFDYGKDTVTIHTLPATERVVRGGVEVALQILKVSP